MAINVPKLYKEYIQGNDQLDFRRRDVQEDDIVLTNVKLEVVKTEWFDKFPLADPEVCAEVKYTQKNAGGSKAFGHFDTHKKSQNSAKVILQKGIVRGLNSTFKLPLDQNKKDLIGAFGSHLYVDPSKEEFVHQQQMMAFNAAVDGEIPPKGATATVCERQKEYIGHFVCTVIMKGKCLANGSQQQIGDVIYRMQSAQPTNTDLKVMRIMERWGKKGKKNVVQFVIEGDLECKWDFKGRMEWKMNP